MNSHVFISYASPDRELADRLCGTLESRGIACWIAPRDIQPGAEWAEQIIDGINLADVMLLIFSSHSNASPQVRREIERAVHRQVPLLPVRVENVLPSKGLEYFLGTPHWAGCPSRANRTPRSGHPARGRCTAFEAAPCRAGPGERTRGAYFCAAASCRRAGRGRRLDASRPGQVANPAGRIRRACGRGAGEARRCASS